MFHSGVFRIFLAALFLGSQLQAVTISHTEAGKHVGQEVEVTGTVEMQNEKPKIILRTADSIRISSTAPAAEAPQTTEPAAPAHFVIQAAMRHLDEKHNGAKDWPLYLGGNSSGSGRRV